MTTLIEKVQEAQFAGLLDWQVADLLNTPSVPARRRVDAGRIIEYLDAQGIYLSIRAAARAGNEAAIALVEGLKDAAQTGILIDVDGPSATTIIAGLLADSVITPAHKAGILALGDTLISWAQANGVEVTARDVGLARGAG